MAEGGGEDRFLHDIPDEFRRTVREETLNKRHQHYCRVNPKDLTKEELLAYTYPAQADADGLVSLQATQQHYQDYVRALKNAGLYKEYKRLPMFTRAGFEFTQRHGFGVPAPPPPPFEPGLPVSDPMKALPKRVGDVLTPAKDDLYQPPIGWRIQHYNGSTEPAELPSDLQQHTGAAFIDALFYYSFQEAGRPVVFDEFYAYAARHLNARRNELLPTEDERNTQVRDATEEESASILAMGVLETGFNDPKNTTTIRHAYNRLQSWCEKTAYQLYFSSGKVHSAVMASWDEACVKTGTHHYVHFTKRNYRLLEKLLHNMISPLRLPGWYYVTSFDQLRGPRGEEILDHLKFATLCTPAIGFDCERGQLQGPSTHSWDTAQRGTEWRRGFGEHVCPCLEPVRLLQLSTVTGVTVVFNLYEMNRHNRNQGAGRACNIFLPDVVVRLLEEPGVFKVGHAIHYDVLPVFNSCVTKLPPMQAGDPRLFDRVPSELDKPRRVVVRGFVDLQLLMRAVDIPQDPRIVFGSASLTKLMFGIDTKDVIVDGVLVGSYTDIVYVMAQKKYLEGTDFDPWTQTPLPQTAMSYIPSDSHHAICCFMALVLSHTLSFDGPEIFKLIVCRGIAERWGDSASRGKDGEQRHKKQKDKKKKPFGCIAEHFNEFMRTIGGGYAVNSKNFTAPVVGGDVRGFGIREGCFKAVGLAYKDVYKDLTPAQAVTRQEGRGAVNSLAVAYTQNHPPPPPALRLTDGKTAFKRPSSIPPTVANRTIPRKSVSDFISGSTRNCQSSIDNRAARVRGSVSDDKTVTVRGILTPHKSASACTDDKTLERDCGVMNSDAPGGLRRARSVTRIRSITPSDAANRQSDLNPQRRTHSTSDFVSPADATSLEEESLLDQPEYLTDGVDIDNPPRWKDDGASLLDITTLVTMAGPHNNDFHPPTVLYDIEHGSVVVPHGLFKLGVTIDAAECTPYYDPDQVLSRLHHAQSDTRRSPWDYSIYFFCISRVREGFLPFLHYAYRHDDRPSHELLRQTIPPDDMWGCVRIFVERYRRAKIFRETLYGRQDSACEVPLLHALRNFRHRWVFVPYLEYAYTYEVDTRERLERSDSPTIDVTCTFTMQPFDLGVPPVKKILPVPRDSIDRMMHMIKYTNKDLEVYGSWREATLRKGATAIAFPNVPMREKLLAEWDSQFVQLFGDISGYLGDSDILTHRLTTRRLCFPYVPAVYTYHDSFGLHRVLAHATPTAFGPHNFIDFVYEGGEAEAIQWAQSQRIVRGLPLFNSRHPKLKAIVARYCNTR